MSIFRSYDIRGIYGKDLTEDIMKGIGNALGNHVKGNVVIARDCRLSSASLKDSFVKGFLGTGKDAVDAGELPLGAAMFYAWKSGLDFAYITASHLPKEWNGIKFFHVNGIGFIEEENLLIRDLYLKGPVIAHKAGKTSRPEWDVIGEYTKYIISKVRPKRKLRIAIDSGDGMAGMIAPRLFREAGFDVDSVFDRPDGNFPNRTPDPVEDPLAVLKKRVLKADIGIAYDGDGDRMVIFDNKGNRLSPEKVSYFILSQLLNEQKGPVVANVECTKTVDVIAGQFNRAVKRVKVGHTFLMDGVAKNKACFGVEVAGHYVVPFIVPFDDSLAVSFYMACVLSGKRGSLDEETRSIPLFPFERVNFDCPDQKKFAVMDALKEEIGDKYGKASFLDGIRVDRKGGWALIRPSNTGPVIRLTVEGSTEGDKDEIKGIFSKIVRKGIDKAI